jgi:hypothetical protein
LVFDKKTYTPEVKTTNKTVFFLAEVDFLVPGAAASTASPSPATALRQN